MVIGALLVVTVITRGLLQDRNIGGGRFRDDVLDQPVEQFGTVLDGQFRVRTKLDIAVTW